MSIRNNNQHREEFKEFFGPMMPHIRKLKLAGHIGAFLTEFFVLFKISSGNLPVNTKLVLYVISFLLAGFVSAMIEVGISKFTPFTLKQIIRWKFADKWFKWMFWLVCLFITLPLFVSHPILSGIGGQEIIEHTMKAPTLPQLDSLEKKFEAKKIQLQTDNAIQTTKVIALYIAKEEPIMNQYKALIAQQENIKAKYQKLLKEGNIWAKENSNKAANEIERLTAEMNKALSPIRAEKTTTINRQDSSLAANIKYYQEETDNKKNLILSRFGEDDRKAKARTWLWGNILSFAAIFCALATFVCVLIIVVYNEGSGESEGQETSDNQVKNGSFIGGLFKKILPDFGSFFDPKTSGQSEVLPSSQSEVSKFETRRKIGFEITNESEVLGSNKTSKTSDSPEVSPSKTSDSRQKPLDRKPSEPELLGSKKTSDLPMSRKDKDRNFTAVLSAYYAIKKSGREPSIKEVSDATNISTKTVSTYIKEIKN
jgi:hypothetical protein